MRVHKCGSFRGCVHIPAQGERAGLVKKKSGGCGGCVACGAALCGVQGCGGCVGAVRGFACVVGACRMRGGGLFPRLLLQLLCAASSGLSLLAGT